MSRNITPTFWQTTRSLLQQKRVLFSSFLIALVYVIIVIALPNKTLITQTLLQASALSFKVKLISIVFQGDFALLSPLGRVLLLLTSIFVGFNLTLFFLEVKRLSKIGKIHITSGTGTILGLTLTGCSSCGFSLLSLFGVTFSFGFMPFGDIILRSIALSLVIFSTVYLLRKSHEDVLCAVKPRTTKTSSRRK